MADGVISHFYTETETFSLVFFTHRTHLIYYFIIILVVVHLLAYPDRGRGLYERQRIISFTIDVI